jgi:hypothetical protein
MPNWCLPDRIRVLARALEAGLHTVCAAAAAESGRVLCVFSHRVFHRKPWRVRDTLMKEGASRMKDAGCGRRDGQGNRHRTADYESGAIRLRAACSAVPGSPSSAELAISRRHRSEQDREIPLAPISSMLQTDLLSRVVLLSSAASLWSAA